MTGPPPDRPLLPRVDDGFSLYSFSEAAGLFPSLKITSRSLRTEYDRGNLDVVRVAGKLFVTPAALKAMVERNTIAAGRLSLKPETSAAVLAGDGASVARARRVAEQLINQRPKRRRPVD